MAGRGMFGDSGPAGHAPLDRGHRPPQLDQADRAPDRGAEQTDRDELAELHHSAGNAAVTSMFQPATAGDLVRSVVNSPGKQLDGATSSFVRSATGQDPTSIQLHEGPEAAAAAKSVDAEMFASGNHLVAPKGLDVTTREGAFKTVHEVHHILNQQAKGPVDGTETGDGLKISDPSDRFEQDADRAAATAVADHFDGR